MEFVVSKLTQGKYSAFCALHRGEKWKLSSISKLPEQLQCPRHRLYTPLKLYWRHELIKFKGVLMVIERAG